MTGSDSRKPDADLDKKGVWGAGLEVKRAVLGALMGPGKIRLKRLSQQDSPTLSTERDPRREGPLLIMQREKETLGVGDWPALAFLLVLTGKNSTAVQETWVQSLGWEDPPEEGVATHSIFLPGESPMDRGAWRAIVHGVAKSWTRLRRLSKRA